MSKKLLLVLVFAFLSATAISQNAKQQHPIVPLDQYISQLKSSGDVKTASQVETLIKDVHPSDYATAGNVEHRGGSPMCLFVDAKTLNTPGAFKSSDVQKANIELVTIKINNASDMNGGIDLSAFADFPKLKYVYILAEYVTTTQNIIASVENNNPNYSIFLNVLPAN